MKKQIIVFGIVVVLAFLSAHSISGLKTNKWYDFSCFCADDNFQGDSRFSAYFTFVSPDKSIQINNTIGTNQSDSMVGFWNYSYNFKTGGLWSIYCNCSNISSSRMIHLYEVNVYDTPLTMSTLSPTSNGTVNYDYIFFWVKLNMVGNAVVEINGTNYSMVNLSYLYGLNDVDFVLNLTGRPNGNYSYKFYANDSEGNPFFTVTNWIVLNNLTTVPTATYVAPPNMGYGVNPVQPSNLGAKISPDKSDYIVNLQGDTRLQFPVRYFSGGILTNARIAEWLVIKDDTVLNKGNFMILQPGTYQFDFDFKDYLTGDYKIFLSFDGKNEIVNLKVISVSKDLDFVTNWIMDDKGNIRPVRAVLGILFIIFVVIIVFVFVKYLKKR